MINIMDNSIPHEIIVYNETPGMEDVLSRNDIFLKSILKGNAVVLFLINVGNSNEELLFSRK